MAHGDAIGLFGLGLMGEALTARLVPAGYRVIGFDVDAAKAAGFSRLGGTPAGSATEAAHCGIVILAVFSTDQVEDVVENTILPAGGEGRIVLCTSTCDPDRVAALAARVEPRGIRFLETPVSGTSAQARSGDGVGLIGGDPSVAEAVKPVLDVLFPRRFHIGKVGDGGRAKLAVNLILGLNRLALAEGLTLAGRLGLDLATFLDVARASAAYSQCMDTKGRKMIEREFSPEGRVRQTLKDFHLMHDLATSVGQKLPAMELNIAVLEACVAAGEGDLDNSAVIEEIRRRRT